MKRILLLTFVSLAVSLVAAKSPYDFRDSDAYRKLSAADKQRLEQVHRDLVLLWGALDMYADEHNGNLPANLDDLAPKYLVELPSDRSFCDSGDSRCPDDSRLYPIQERHGIPIQERCFG